MRKINNKGFTLSEVLVATILMLLVSLGLTTGIALSNKQFVNSIQQSEAQELYSTLSSLISNELRFTTQINLNNGDVLSFYSFTYALEDRETSLVSLDEKGNETETYGYLALGSNKKYNKLIGDASYPNNLGANGTIKYKDGYFVINLKIGTIEGKEIISKTFNVIPLNSITTE